MPAKKKQGYSARLDERLGMTRGKQAGKKMSAAGRRKVSKATRKPKGTYGFKAKKKLWAVLRFKLRLKSSKKLSV